jgi:rhomboid family GlyGly-CTERM serine protease
MGLNQADDRGRAGVLPKDWLLPILAAAVAVGIALTGDAGREILRYDRAAIASGELWRLLSGHFAHLGTSHLILNILGLLLVWFLVAAHLTRKHWLVVAAVVITGVDVGFWFLQPQLLGYVGLSGLLHGLLAAGVVAGLGSGRAEPVILAVILVAKVAYEQLAGPLPGSEASTGGNVIVAAHAYGAITGAIAAGIIQIRVRDRTPI